MWAPLQREEQPGFLLHKAAVTQPTAAITPSPQFSVCQALFFGEHVCMTLLGPRRRRPSSGKMGEQRSLRAGWPGHFRESVCNTCRHWQTVARRKQEGWGRGFPSSVTQEEDRNKSLKKDITPQQAHAHPSIRSCLSRFWENEF